MLAGICTDGLLRPFQTTSLWFSPGSARHSSSDSFSLSVLAWTHSLIFMDLYMCIEFCWIVNQMQDGISSSIKTFNNTFLSIFSPHGSISPLSFLYLRPISLLLPSSNPQICFFTISLASSHSSPISSSLHPTCENIFYPSRLCIPPEGTLSSFPISSCSLLAHSHSPVFLIPSFVC